MVLGDMTQGVTVVVGGWNWRFGGSFPTPQRAGLSWRPHGCVGALVRGGARRRPACLPRLPAPALYGGAASLSSPRDARGSAPPRRRQRWGSPPSPGPGATTRRAGGGEEGRVPVPVPCTRAPRAACARCCAAPPPPAPRRHRPAQVAPGRGAAGRAPRPCGGPGGRLTASPPP